MLFLNCQLMNHITKIKNRGINWKKLTHTFYISYSLRILLL
ncbi:hypothetical protein ENTCAN_05331 [Enterobacter cancerogenus ATCC 35316]|nr:hypothetical protein ENTCAN_05331 [Enterobacter cancerogenus ATCC 35316]